MDTKPLVSVIIPVFNDTKRLQRCLVALEKQTYDPDRYEVLVIDNGSDNDMRWLQREYHHVWVHEEATPGSYAARNRGISLAKGSIIGFTDADCIPNSNWIERGVIRLGKRKDVGIVGGKIEFFFKDNHRPNAVELFDAIRNLQQEAHITKNGFAATANLFTFKRLFDEAGGFDASVKSGGDREWGQRIAALGYRLEYADDVRVQHPARYSFKELYRKTTRVVGGEHELKRKTGYHVFHPAFLKTLALDISPPIRFASRIIKDDRVQGMRNKVKVITVFTCDKYMRAWTRLRLQFGGMSRR